MSKIAQNRLGQLGRSHVDEIIGVILLALSVLVGISLLTYSASDPSFFNLNSSSSEVNNLIGFVGSFSSDMFFQLIGIAAFLLPLACFVCGCQKIFSSSHSSPGRVRTAGSLLALLSLSALFQLYLPQSADFSMPWSPVRNPGGIVGDVLVRWMEGMFGQLGGEIIAFSVLIISMILIFTLSPAGILTFVFNLTKSTLFVAVRSKLLAAKEKKKDKGGLPASSVIRISGHLPGGGENVRGVPRISKEKTGIASPDAGEEERWLISDEGNTGQYQLPPVSFLADSPPRTSSCSKDELLTNARVLEKKLQDFDVQGRVVHVHPGPVITMYEYEPAPGVKINTVANLSNDIALAMKALAVRIIAPIPGKSVIGIEIPNKTRELVVLKDILLSPEFKVSDYTLPLAMGKDIFGAPVITDLRTMPHLLIAGATGSGKSVGLNSMITSLLFAKTPGEVRMLLIDPKMLELVSYENIPHLICPIVVDPKEAIIALKKMVVEMERRYMLLSASGVRNLEGYNELKKDKDKILARLAKNGEIFDYEIPDRLPHIVVIVDELADLMLTSAKLVEEPISRLAQMARAAGIHLILATQRPSVNVLTGVIKANFPARVAFQVSSQIDSRTIIDTKGAEQLLGMGDMLFLHPKSGKLTRIHCAYITEQEIEKVTDFLKIQPRLAGECDLLSSIPGEEIDNITPVDGDASYEDRDEVYQKAVDLVLSTKKASASFIQRRMRLGYPRAARMIEQMETDGLIGPADGKRPREILVKHYE